MPTGTVYRDRALSVLEPAGPLETKRLLLRPFVAEDFDAVFAMQSRPDVARYLYWHARNEDEIRTALEKKIAGTAIRSESDALFLAAVVKAAGELVGDIVLHWISREHRTGEIGFIVHPEHQGHGYATESVGVLLRLAFEDLQLPRHRPCRGSERRVGARPGEARDAAGSAPDRERVRERRVAERARLRDPRPRVAGDHRASARVKPLHTRRRSLAQRLSS